DLVALVIELAADYQRTTDRHELRVETDETMLIGEWDRGRLERALGNLVSNAVKFSPEGGAVTIALKREMDPVESALVSVTDQGIGIPAEARPRVFERFFRASNAVGRVDGSGLGLSAA